MNTQSASSLSSVVLMHLAYQCHCFLEATKALTMQLICKALDYGRLYLSIPNIEQVSIDIALRDCLYANKMTLAYPKPYTDERICQSEYNSHQADMYGFGGI